MTQGELFRVQAAVAAAVALAVLRGSRIFWLAAAAVGVASLLAVVVTVYVPVPALGPFPRVLRYERHRAGKERVVMRPGRR